MDTLRAEHALLQERLKHLESKPPELPAPAPSGLPAPAPSGLSPEMQALMSFANQSKPEGPISHTAALMQAQQAQGALASAVPPFSLSPSAPEFQPQGGGLPQQVGLPPGLGNVHAGATQLLAILNAHRGTAQFNPDWARAFWGSVAQLENQSPFDAAVKGILQSHGYFGLGTVSPPRDSLLGELQQLRDAGAPLGGSVLGLLPGSNIAMAPVDARWEDRLPPDIRRAAPEIYRSLRSQGSASVREWLSANFQGSKQGSQWLDLWNSATEVDFAMAACGGADAQLRRLATDDNMEIKLRRLSAHVYETRTGDRVGAAHMLAIQPPGAGLDLAPTWLISDATAHSKNEHQRNERVKQAGKGKGGGASSSSSTPSATPGGFSRGGARGTGGARARGGKGAGRPKGGALPMG